MPHSKLEPKLVTVLREGYTRKAFFHDLSAGVIVGIVALPLAIAFAIASGVKPEQGLYTAVIGGLVISVFSGSRVQIGGPTGAFVVIIYGIMQKHGYDGLVTATLLAGIILVLLGVFRLGNVIKYIPYPVTVGFTSGIALTIASLQVKDFLGLPIDNMPADFILKWVSVVHNIAGINPWAAGIGLVTIATLIFLPKMAPRIPASLVAVVITTLAAFFFSLPVQTIGTLFGDVSNSFPVFVLPKITIAKIPELVPSAIAIAFLAGIESLLSAVVADGMTGKRHRSNMELVAQGAANIAVVFFGGIPATGAIARTATNIKNGGTTPFAGIFHALVLLLIMLFAGRYVTYIPMAALAGILLVVAYRMSEIKLFIKLLKSPKSDVLVLLVTFGLTVFMDLTVAIQVGIVLASLLFMRRMSNTTEAYYETRGESGGAASSGILGDDEENEEEEDENSPASLTRKRVPEGVEVFQINGPFFFGAADMFRSQLALLEKKPRVLILRMRRVPAIDATALQALEDIVEKSGHDHTTVILSGPREKPLAVLKQYGIVAKVGERNITSGIDASLARAAEILAEKHTAT